MLRRHCRIKYESFVQCLSAIADIEKVFEEIGFIDAHCITFEQISLLGRPER